MIWRHQPKLQEEEKQVTASPQLLEFCWTKLGDAGDFFAVSGCTPDYCPGRGEERLFFPAH